eukprot:8746821-Pyramimonas_sp.AAC.1
MEHDGFSKINITPRARAMVASRDLGGRPSGAVGRPRERASRSPAIPSSSCPSTRPSHPSSRLLRRCARRE